MFAIISNQVYTVYTSNKTAAALVTLGGSTPNKEA